MFILQESIENYTPIFITLHKKKEIKKQINQQTNRKTKTWILSPFSLLSSRFYLNYITFLHGNFLQLQLSTHLFLSSFLGSIIETTSLAISCLVQLSSFYKLPLVFHFSCFFLLSRHIFLQTYEKSPSYLLELVLSTSLLRFCLGTSRVDL